MENKKTQSGNLCQFGMSESAGFLCNRITDRLVLVLMRKELIAARPANRGIDNMYMSVGLYRIVAFCVGGGGGMLRNVKTVVVCTCCLY